MTESRWVWFGSLTTRHFSFESFGADAAACRGAMFDGLKAHAATHGLDSSWAFESMECAVFREVRLGACYRDYVAISPNQTTEDSDNGN